MEDPGYCRRRCSHDHLQSAVIPARNRCCCCCCCCCWHFREQQPVNVSERLSPNPEKMGILIFRERWQSNNRSNLPFDMVSTRFDCVGRGTFFPFPFPILLFHILEWVRDEPTQDHIEEMALSLIGDSIFFFSHLRSCSNFRLYGGNTWSYTLEIAFLADAEASANKNSRGKKREAYFSALSHLPAKLACAPEKKIV